MFSVLIHLTVSLTLAHTLIDTVPPKLAVFWREAYGFVGKEYENVSPTITCVRGFGDCSALGATIT